MDKSELEKMQEVALRIREMREIFGFSPEEMAQQLAEFCARLHALPVPLAAPHDLNFYLSPQEVAETRAGLSSDPALSQTFEQAANRVKAYDQSEAPLSVVHDDLHPGNLLIQDGELSVILDFGDCRVTHPLRDFFQPFYHDFKRYFLHKRYFGLSAMLMRNYTQLTHRAINLAYLADLATLRIFRDGLQDQLDLSERLSQLAEYTRQYQDLL